MRRLTLATIALVRFNIDWFVLCCVAIGLSSANVVGYTKCSSDAKQKAQLAQVCVIVIVGYMSRFRPDFLFEVVCAHGDHYASYSVLDCRE